MKGVIVQVGEPKSIVLFNNGKIAAIPTPANCHVGMVVTVKFNNKLKILAVALAAVLLVGTGVCIGVSLVKNNTPKPPAAVETMDKMMDNTPNNGMHGGHGHRRWWNE
jgi:hypothetical protein